MKEELDTLAASSNGQFTVTYSLTQADEDNDDDAGDWGGARGRGSAELAVSALGAPDSSGEESIMIMVCGTDGFVSTWAGPITREKTEDGKKRKVQGPLLGFLKDAGFSESHVYKF
uniref:Uncharacterized protein n=1 Tax=Octactis speculum TaxID=3111310 RepID=A0A7S2GJR1_9STRA|mmetsp:Transcript_50551/g.68777  ORF Transcript_50551/g.68777 Transcript_50551/m.68777 type:complete len:116 (+) Transcript_50551:491-838(+)